VSFGRPILLLTLFLLPVCGCAWALIVRRPMRHAVHFTNLDVLAQVSGGRAWRRHVASALFLLALAALCTAMASPRVKRVAVVDRATVILALDASGSMQSHDVKPTRLAAAEQAARDFLDRVPRRLRVGLIVFAGEPKVAVRPTTNRALVRDAVDRLGGFSGHGGTAIGDALAAAVKLGRQSLGGGGDFAVAQDKATAPVSILFLSDGEQTRGRLLPLAGAELARTAGFRVDTVALGTAMGMLILGDSMFQRISVPPDPRTLRAIARMTGGEFFNATSTARATGAYSKLGSSLGRAPTRRDLTFVFVGVAAALTCGAIGLSQLRVPTLP
jgi:Ca-activated chloride channel family protein